MGMIEQGFGPECGWGILVPQALVSSVDQESFGSGTSTVETAMYFPGALFLALSWTKAFQNTNGLFVVLIGVDIWWDAAISSCVLCSVDTTTRSAGQCLSRASMMAGEDGNLNCHLQTC
jgi:hypothetical protein